MDTSAIAEAPTEVAAETDSLGVPKSEITPPNYTNITKTNPFYVGYDAHGVPKNEITPPPKPM